MNNKKLGFFFFALAAAILVASCASSVYVFKKHNAESSPSEIWLINLSKRLLLQDSKPIIGPKNSSDS